MKRNLFLQKMTPVNLTFDKLNQKSIGILSSYRTLTMLNVEVMQ